MEKTTIHQEIKYIKISITYIKFLGLRKYKNII